MSATEKGPCRCWAFYALDGELAAGREHFRTTLGGREVIALTGDCGPVFADDCIEITLDEEAAIRERLLLPTQRESIVVRLNSERVRRRAGL